MSYPTEREYAVFRRGEQREAMLADYREGLRALFNPDTGAPYTEDELARASAVGGWIWRRFESIDLVLLGTQKRNEYLANQIRIDRAGSAYLRSYHSALWDLPYLPAFGASGQVLATGNPGITWLGSTTVPDGFAVRGTDPAGNRYQVVIGGTADVNRQATLTLIGIDGGDETNIPVGTKITWINAPIGSDDSALVVTAKFSGGLDAETDADFARRLAAEVRHKPGSGNWAQVRAFARGASVSVEDAFVYACAFDAGSELVAVTQKRATPGPLARIPSLSVLSAVRAALVPPGSSTLPGTVHVVVVPPVAQSDNLVVRLSQPVGSGAGWTDLEPFPAINGSSAIAITTLTGQTDFRITTSGAGQLPNGASSATDVHLMVWDVSTSAFVPLSVSLVTDMGSGVYRVQLVAQPAKTLALGDWISPDMARRATLAAGATAYFDLLGPGEVLSLTADERGGRAFRNPVPAEEYPARAGQGVINVIAEALGATVGDTTLASIGATVPTVPSDPVTGPSLLVLGKFGVYHLT